MKMIASIVENFSIFVDIVVGFLFFLGKDIRTHHVEDLFFKAGLAARMAF